jgi:hypothetical protein
MSNKMCAVKFGAWSSAAHPLHGRIGNQVMRMGRVRQGEDQILRYQSLRMRRVEQSHKVHVGTMLFLGAAGRGGEVRSMVDKCDELT